MTPGQTDSDEARSLTARRAVIFDLDGTLIDSLPLVLRAFSHALEPYVPSTPSMDIFASLGGPPSRVFARLLGGERHVSAALQRLDDYLRMLPEEIPAFGGAGDLLESLHARGIPLAIWTGRDRETTERLLERLGWTRTFTSVVCGDDLSTHKPDPAGLLSILQALDCRPAEAVLLGDADVDVLGGAAGGVDTVLIRRGREVDARVFAQAWQVREEPAEAFRFLLDHFDGRTTAAKVGRSA